MEKYAIVNGWPYCAILYCTRVKKKKLRMDLIMKISKLFARNFLNIINEHFKLEVMEPPVWNRETNGCTQGGHLVGWLNASADSLCCALFVNFRFIFNHQFGVWFVAFVSHCVISVMCFDAIVNSEQ